MFKFIGSLWNGLWKIVSWLRAAFVNLLFLLVLIVIIASIVSAPRFEMPAKTALYIAPEGYLVDQKTYKPTPAELLLGSEDRIAETPLRELIGTVIQASKDKRITALVLDLNHFVGGGISKMEELGQALNQFKAAGKPIYAYADNYSQQQYFLASYADTIYMNDMGNLLLTGFGVYRNYYKDAADKLAVKFHVFRVGDYKDAVEPFMRNDMSTASREHNSRWLNELWQRYTQVVSQNRQLPQSEIESYIISIATESSQTEETLATIAQSQGLVDELHSRSGIRKALIEQVGKDDEDDTFKAISYSHYRHAMAKHSPQNKNNIGLIVAAGNILDGKQDNGAIGGDSLSELIRQAREDESLKALVIRVNSGGGSAFASEVIRREILEAQEQELPVYISMGSMAASGGYWISTAAEQIWATPSTLTGSIGVWGLIPNIADSVNKIGIHSDGIGTTSLSDIYHIDRELSAPAQILIQNGVNDVYTRFLNIVAEARNSDPTSVNEIAGGRVWTGEAAKSLGLVDNIGTLNDLIISVASDRELDSYGIKVIEKPLSTSEEIMRALMEDASVKLEGIILEGPLKNIGILNRLASMSTSSPTINSLVQILKQIKLSTEEGQQPATMAYCMECYTP
ncbi:signal peptide peptidase SppA [Teredinibacter haidensis]|uniref:signal peptide peptidase SppA n=1 Tax=Teredinibacter haidensis TaxID=2731755 RepID=UPI000948B7FD|nr:signal peptide peptidase SppA [Teredinibacter haidensis]